MREGSEESAQRTPRGQRRDCEASERDGGAKRSGEGSARMPARCARSERVVGCALSRRNARSERGSALSVCAAARAVTGKGALRYMPRHVSISVDTWRAFGSHSAAKHHRPGAWRRVLCRSHASRSVPSLRRTPRRCALTAPPSHIAAPGVLGVWFAPRVLLRRFSMSRHLDRLFTQAFTGEEAKAAPGPRRPEAVPPAAVEEEAADPSEPGRILAAHKRKDYAACLGLPPVTLDALGRPEWPVTDRRAPVAHNATAQLVSSARCFSLPPGAHAFSSPTHAPRHHHHHHPLAVR